MWKYVKCSYHLSLFLKGLESHHPYRAVISTHTSIPRCLHTPQFSVSTNHIYIPPICYTVESLWNLVKDCELLLLYNKIKPQYYTRINNIFTIQVHVLQLGENNHKYFVVIKLLFYQPQDLFLLSFIVTFLLLFLLFSHSKIEWLWFLVSESSIVCEDTTQRKPPFKLVLWHI